MDPAARELWQSEVLDAILESFAASDALTCCLIFKGARVLSRRLAETGRKSLDIDTNLDQRFADTHPGRSNQLDYLSREVARALRNHFGQQDPVRFDLLDVRVEPKPREDHPRGWNAFLVSVSVRDLTKPGVRGLPVLTVDVAAPEVLGRDSVAPLSVGEHEVTAYTLPRIAGEKLRAFPTSLTASASRYVDCAGLMTFEEDLDVTKATYEADTTIPKDIPFEAAWAVLRAIVQLMEGLGVIPFAKEIDWTPP